MQTSLFLQNKIKRQILFNGSEFTFVRSKKDKFHQVVENEVEAEMTVKGLFHTTNIYVRENVSEASRTITKQQPMILTLYDEGSQIELSDSVEMQGKKYKVTNKIDINNFGIAYDICLEEFLDE